MECKLSNAHRKHWSMEKESKRNFYIPGESRRYVPVGNKRFYCTQFFVIYLRLFWKTDLRKAEGTEAKLSIFRQNLVGNNSYLNVGLKNSRQGKSLYSNKCFWMLGKCVMLIV